MSQASETGTVFGETLRGIPGGGTIPAQWESTFWGDWASQTAQGASPRYWERASPMRFLLAWAREGRET